MKYSLDDAVNEIGRRKKEMIHRKQRRQIGILTVLTVLNVFLLAAALYRYISPIDIDGSYSGYGSFLLPEEAGGYIIVGVLCFIAAVILTLLCIRWKKKKDDFRKSEK